MCMRNHRRAVPVADAVLNDAAHVAGIDGEKLARHGGIGNLRLHLVGDAIELPSERGGNHRDRFGQPDMADRSALDLALELLARQPRANLLLKRQPPACAHPERG